MCDVRTGRQPNVKLDPYFFILWIKLDFFKQKDQNLLNKLSDKALTNGWSNIDQRTIIISSGPDLVNISNLVITGSSDKGTRVIFFSIKNF